MADRKAIKFKILRSSDGEAWALVGEVAAATQDAARRAWLKAEGMGEQTRIVAVPARFWNPVVPQTKTNTVLTFVTAGPARTSAEAVA